MFQLEHQIHNPRLANWIELIFDTFLELHGDRRSGDDKTVIGGLARLDNYRTVVISYQGGESGETSGAHTAAGYRKCSRLIRLAEVFGKPAIVFIDAWGFSSFPESGWQQANEAMVRNLEEMSCLMAPVVAVLTGEPGSAIAVDTCAADRVIARGDVNWLFPKSGGISADDVDSEPVSLSPQDLQDLHIVHRTVEVPSKGGSESLSGVLRDAILEELGQLTQIHPEALVQQRLHRLQSQFMNFEKSRFFRGSNDNTSRLGC